MEVVEEFKLSLGALIKTLIDAGQEEGITNEALCAIISAECLVLAAYMHRGEDVEFLPRARRALSLVRTGAVEQ